MNGTVISFLEKLTFKTSPPTPSPMERGLFSLAKCPPLHRRGVGAEVLKRQKRNFNAMNSTF
jgi:hypothetical protein